MKKEKHLLRNMVFLRVQQELLLAYLETIRYVKLNCEMVYARSFLAYVTKKPRNNAIIPRVI